MTIYTPKCFMCRGDAAMPAAVHTRHGRVCIPCCRVAVEIVMQKITPQVAHLSTSPNAGEAAEQGFYHCSVEQRIAA